jgi:hypothetical protein
MPNSRFFPLMSFVLALLLLVGGCGGGDETAAPTKKEFIKQAEAICLKTDKQQGEALEGYLEEHPKGITTGKGREIEAIEVLVVPSLKSEADELAALGAPSGDEDQVEAIVVGLEDSVRKLEEDPLAFRNEKKLFGEIDAKAKRYGFKECSELL